MSDEFTAAEVRAWADRWKMVNAAEIAELRSTPVEVKLRQLASLMASVDAMGWREALADEVGVAEVRDRWRRLREAYGV